MYGSATCGEEVEGQGDATASSCAALAWSNINYKVGDKQILTGLSGSLSRCTCLAVLGPSGCGKTSLLHVLAQCLPRKAMLTSGVLFDGALPTKQNRKNCAFVF